MRNKYVASILYGFILSSFVFALFTKTSIVYAETPTPTPTIDPSTVKQSERWACLEVKWCIDAAAACPLGRNGHRVRLSAKSDFKLMPDKDTYIVECVSTATGPVCTTGDATKDAEIFETSNTDALNAIGYKFEGMFQSNGRTPQSNPIMSNAAGDIPTVEWQSSTPRATVRKFLGLNFFTPDFSSGDSGGQQQATFDISNSESDCVSVRWDPYGIVFDSQTLEPMPRARVELQKKDPETGEYTKYTDEGLVNPQTTEEDGVFNFVVPDGIYRLEVTKNSHLFPADFDNIHQNANRVYSDLYPEPDKDGITPVPTGDPRAYDIVQQGEIKHHDIPFDPKSPGQAVRNPATLMDYFYQLAGRYSSIVVVEGRSSHPFTKVKVYSIASTANPTNATPLRLIRELVTNNQGKFKFEIDQSKLQPGEKFGTVVLQKQDLTQTPFVRSAIQKVFSTIMSKVFGKVEAQENDTETTVLDPIPNYIEGYAYDKNGNTLKNATVAIYLTFSDKAYYETKTDSTGYYKVTSEFLPFLPYKIKYTSATGTKTEITTSEFLAANDAVLKEKDIDPYVSRNSKGEVISQTGTSQSPSESPTQGDNGEPVVSPSSTGNILFIVVIILLLMGVAGIVLGVYLMKKKNPRV